MNTKGILICLLLFVVTFSIVGVATQNPETRGIIQITEAKQENGVLEICGTITNARKGTELGLLVYNPDGKIEYVNQLTLMSGNQNGETAFSFPALSTDKRFEKYTAVVRAEEYGKAQKTIEVVGTLSFYVSPDGSDFNKGTFDSPFATVNAAKNAVRRLKSANGGLLPADVTVYLRGGVYPVYQTISFTEDDSGTNGHTVTYCAYRDEIPRLVATKRMFNKWTEGENGVWISNTTPMGNYDMQSLSDGKSLVGISARFPDQGYLSAKKVYNPSNSYGSLSSFAIRTEDNVPEISDIQSLFVSIWSNGPGWYNWTNYVESVKSIENGAGGRIVNFYGDISSTPINNGARYYLRGAEEFLNQPGEYYYDRNSGTLKFIPPSGFNMTENTVIYASSTTPVFYFMGKFGDGVDGRPADGKPVESVENIIISGLDISGTGRASAISISGAENIEISGCNIHDCINTAIGASNAVSGLKIDSNKLSNIGGAGVYLAMQGVAGGAMMDMGIHCIDILQYLSGVKAVEVMGMTGNRIFDYPDTEDIASAIMKMENGAFFTVEASFNIPDMGGGKFEIYGTKGSIVANGTLSQIEVGDVVITTVENDEVNSARMEYSSGNMYTKEIESFSASVAEDLPVAVSAQSGILNQRIVEAVYESQKQGKKIKL